VLRAISKTGFSVAMIVLNNVKNDIRVLKTAQSISDIGFDVHVFGVSFDREQKKTTTEKVNGFKVTLIPNPRYELRSVIDKSHTWEYIIQGSLTNMWPLIKKIEPDVVHTHDLNTIRIGKEITERIRTERRDVKWVHDLHEYVRGLDYSDSAIRDLSLNDEKNCIDSPDFLLTVSDTLARKLALDYKLSEAPIVVLNTPPKSNLVEGYGPTIREKLDIEDSPPLIVYSGGVSRARGIHTLVEAMPLIPGAQVAIITDNTGEYIEELIDIAGRNDCLDRLHFTPYVEPHNISNFIRGATIGIHPMLKFGNADVAMPNKLFDYTLADIPIIVSDCPTMKEFVERWGVGEVFVAGDPQSLSKSVNKVLGNIGHYRGNITSDFIDLHSWEYNGQKLVDVYQKLLVSFSDSSDDNHSIAGEITDSSEGFLRGWIGGVGTASSKCMIEISHRGKVISLVDVESQIGFFKDHPSRGYLQWIALLPESHYDGKMKSYSASLLPWGVPLQTIKEKYSLGKRVPVTGEFSKASKAGLEGKIAVNGSNITYIDLDVYYNDNHICSHRVESISPGLKSWSRDYCIPLPEQFHDNRPRRFRVVLRHWKEELVGSPRVVSIEPRNLIEDGRVNELLIENMIPGGGGWGVPAGLEGDGELEMMLEKSSFTLGEEVKVFCSNKDDELLDLSLFRMGDYGGKGARRIRAWKSRGTGEEGSPTVEFTVNEDLFPGTYHISVSNERGLRYFRPICIYSVDSEARILVVHPNIANQLFSQKDNGEFEKIAYFEGFDSVEDSLASTPLAGTMMDCRAGMYSTWVLPAEAWLEKMGIEHVSITDDELHFNPSLALNKDVIIFLGNSRFWTEEIHRIVGLHLSKRREVAILGTGMGDQIVELDEQRRISLFFGNDEYRSGVPLSENWSELDTPIIFGGFSRAPLNMQISSEYFDNEFQYELQGSWDVVTPIVGGEAISLLGLIGNHPTIGRVEIESSIIEFENGSKIFHAGIDNWVSLLEIDEVSQLLHAFVQGDGDSGADPAAKRMHAIEELAYRKWGALPAEGGFRDKNKPVRRICILTALWKRRELSRIVLSHYKEMAENLHPEFDVEIVAVGSTAESKGLVEELGIEYVEYPNSPLSCKWDAGLKHCSILDPDVVIIVGSDDLISEGALTGLCERISEGRMMVGLKDMFMLDVKGKTVNYWSGYGIEEREYETIGMGRCYSRKLLDKLNFSFWGGHEVDRGLDHVVTSKISELGHLPLPAGEEVWLDLDGFSYAFGHVGFTLEEIGGFAIDVKTGLNITKIGDYQLMRTQTLKSSERMLAEYLGSKTTRSIIEFLDGSGVDES